MQQIRALARNRVRLAAVALVVTGALILAWGWAGPSSAPAVAVTAPGPEVSEPAEDDTAALADSTSAPALPEMVIVYISGAVRTPDVYQLAAEARIKDLILAAGGLLPDADAERINLAERLKDSGHIHIPRQGEAIAGGADERADGGQDSQSDVIDINTAGTAELDALSGIGQAIAQRIVEYRTANGPFKTADDLRNVNGIGPALLAKITPHITVGP